MSGRELLLRALTRQNTERPPWVPFVGVHGGQLLGVTAEAYLKSSDHLVNGLTTAATRYRPDGLPIVFDLQIEPEVLGCQLQWSPDNPPAVVSHPMSEMGEGKQLGDLPTFSTEAGRYPVVFDALKRVKQQIGQDVALYGLICGPFTLLSHLMGPELFLTMFDDEDQIDRGMDFCAEVGKTAAAAYLQHGADVVAVVDPMTSQISPEHYGRFVAKPLERIFDAVRQHGGLSSLFVCGDATRNLPQMCQGGCDNVSIDENIDLAWLRDLAAEQGKSFGGNLKLTTALLMGDRVTAQTDTLRCLDIGGQEGFILAPGCDLPYATPPENLEAVAELVHDPYQRDVARAAAEVERATDDYADIVLPDYDDAERVNVDVITLNSEACAPCQYMVMAAQQSGERVGFPVEVHERKIANREGLGFMTKLELTNLPAICVDGKVAFSSIIPNPDALDKALQERWGELGHAPANV